MSRRGAGARSLAIGLVAALASLSLQGCIAAAIPIAAGAALTKRHVANEERASQARQAAVAQSAMATDRSDLKVQATGLTSLPPPTPEPGMDNPAIRDFLAYATRQAGLQPSPGGRSSAILSAASELQAARADCGVLPPAVFVDLDPGRGTFDPLSPGEAAPALGDALAALREDGVKVVWFSRLGSNFAVAARAALAASRLDRSGSDDLVLMPDIGERKQSLRDQTARRLCPIAMLGDERGDFDELFLYLKSPELAPTLDGMIGKGWFLASPFVETNPSTPGATP